MIIKKECKRVKANNIMSIIIIDFYVCVGVNALAVLLIMLSPADKKAGERPLSGIPGLRFLLSPA